MSKPLGRRAYVPKIFPAISFVLVISLNHKSHNTISVHLLCALYPAMKPTGQEAQNTLLLSYGINGLAGTCLSQRLPARKLAVRYKQTLPDHVISAAVCTLPMSEIPSKWKMGRKK